MLYHEDFVGFVLDLSRKKQTSKRRNASAIKLPPDGDYYLLSRRIYNVRHRCDLCGTEEKANDVAVIVQNQGQLDEKIFFAGLNCLDEEYEVDRAKIDSLIKNSSYVRASANKRFGKSFRTTEEVFVETLQLVRENVPSLHADLLVQELEKARAVFTEQREFAENVLETVHFFIVYWREIKTETERFFARLEALCLHPRITIDESILVQARNTCDLALEKGIEVGFTTIVEIKNYFDLIKNHRVRNSAHQQEQYDSDHMYIQAIQNWLTGFVKGDPDRAYWRQKDNMVPRSSLGGKRSTMYARFAVKPRNLDAFLADMRGKKLAYVTEPDQTRYVYEDSYIDRTRDEDGFVKNEKRIRASYEYVLVAVHALEARTRVHELWHKWGKETLETWPIIGT